MIIVGAAGHQGIEYFQLLRNTVSIRGLVDTNYEAMCQIYQKESIPLYHTVEEALDLCSFHSAIVCIPHCYHFSATIPLIKQGKLVIKEKPLALSMQEVHEYRKQDLNRVFTLVQRPFHDMFTTIKNNLQILGKIYDFNYRYYLRVPEKTSGWRGQFTLAGGGVVIDMGYHIFDIILSLFGKPLEVDGALSYCYDPSGDSQLEDSATVTFKYPQNQLHGSVRLNRHADSKVENLEIFGSNGIMTMDLMDGVIKVNNRKGERILEEKVHDPLHKQKMFDFYLKNSTSFQFANSHLAHHANIVELIETLYRRIR
jgi:predicted dehydrogenase